MKKARTSTEKPKSKEKRKAIAGRRTALSSLFGKLKRTEDQEEDPRKVLKRRKSRMRMTTISRRKNRGIKGRTQPKRRR